MNSGAAAAEHFVQDYNSKWSRRVRLRTASFVLAVSWSIPKGLFLVEKLPRWVGGDCIQESEV